MRARALDRRPRGGAALRPADRRARLDVAHAARSPASPSTRRLQDARRGDRAAQPAAADARAGRDRGRRGRRRELLTYVFVGAGYAGLEGLAELQDFAADVVDRYPRCRVAGLRFVLVEARERVMMEIAARASPPFASAELRRRGHRDPDRTRPSSGSPRPHRRRSPRGEVVPARTVVWTAGVKPHPVVAELGLPLDGGGRIAADRFCAVAGRPGVWAIGDAAAVPDPARKGKPVAADGPARAPPGEGRGRQRRPRARGRAAAAGARSATARSACSSTWAATRPWPARSASAGAASRPGSSPAPTTWR